MTTNWQALATAPDTWRRLIPSTGQSDAWIAGPTIGGWAVAGAGVTNDTEVYNLLYAKASANEDIIETPAPVEESEEPTPEAPVLVSLPATPSILPSDTGLPSVIDTANLPAWFDPYWNKIIGWLGNITDMFWFVPFFSNDPSDAGW